MAMNIKNITPGDVLSYWFDTGAMGPQLCWAKVIRVGATRVTVAFENGRRASVSPNNFSGKARPDEYGESKPEWLPQERLRCAALVYKKDTYRVARGTKSGFRMHYERCRCTRMAIKGSPFCGQHAKTPGTALY